jgi:hypothetical protein
MNLPATRATPKTGIAAPRALRPVGVRWWGYLLAAALVAGAAGGHLAFSRRINQQARRVWHRVFEEDLPSRSLEVRDWFTARALAGELGRAITLSDGDEREGRIFLVLNVSFSPELLGLRAMKPEELAGYRKAQRDANIAEGWVCEWQREWLNILLPDYSTLAPVGFSRNTDQPRFEECASRDLIFRQKPSEIVYSFAWKVDEKLAESGQLRLEFRRYHPLPLTRKRALETRWARSICG